MTTTQPPSSKKSSNRDNFPSSVKKVLRERVGGICSNPDCGAPTFGPKGDDEAFHTGHAAHICAAAPGGPRYDPEMSPEQRRGLDNGIWVCSGCSPKIDGDVSSYSVATLRQWKVDAEAKARAAQGMRPTRESDITRLLQQALNPVQPPKSLTTAINEVIYEQSRALEALDSRFTVTPSWRDGVSTFELHATQPVRATWTFKPQANLAYKDGFRALVEHGRPFTFSLADATLKGSPLLEKLFSADDGRVVIARAKIPAVAYLHLTDPGSGINETLVEFQGTLVGGSKSAMFEGSAMEGCLGLATPVRLGAHHKQSTMTFGVQLDSWNGSLLKNLPYLSKLLKLYEKLLSPGQLSITIEVKGEEAWRASCDSLMAEEHTRETYDFLKFAACVRQLSMAFNPSIRWDIQKIEQMSDVGELLEAASILNGTERPVSDTPRAPLEFIASDAEGYRQLKELSLVAPVDFKFLETQRRQLLIFGSACLLPGLVISVESAFFKFKNGRRLASGKFSGKIVIVAAPGFSMRRTFTD